MGPRFKWKFTPLEDIRLTEVVLRCGCQNWGDVARYMPGRNPRQCRERWMNYINPQLSHTPLTAEEDLLLEKKYNEIGSHWKLIASFFPGRSRNFIKNYWMAKHKRQLRAQPVTLLPPIEPPRPENAPTQGQPQWR
jgi:hypothetical protein